MKIKKSGLISVTLLFIIMLLVGCSSNELAYEGGLKVVSGSEETVIAYNDIYKMETEEVEMKGLSSTGETVEKKVKGVNITSVFSKCGISMDSITSLRLIAGDGYEIDVPKEVFTETEFLLAYEFDGEELDEKKMPLRAAINDVRTMYWVSNLVEIQIITESEEIVSVDSNLQTYYILEEAIKALDVEDYTYYDSVDKAIKIKDLLDLYVANTSESVKFTCADGFEKTEDLSVLLDAYIKITGENAPLFIAPDMPKGMHIKEILTLTCGDVTFLSGKISQDKFTQKTARNKSGSDLEELMSYLNMTAETVEFIAADDFSIEVERSQMKEGILNLIDDTTYQIKFGEKFDKGTSVKSVLKFRAGSGVNLSVPAGGNESETSSADEKSEMAAWSVEFGGLSDGSFNLDSEKAARKLEEVIIEATKVKKDGSKSTSNYTGYRLLDALTFLKVENFTSITFIAGDGYEAELTKEMIDDETIIAFAVDGENLSGDNPLILIVKNQASSTWVKSLAKIIIK